MVDDKDDSYESQIAKLARIGDIGSIRELLREVCYALDCATNWSLSRRPSKNSKSQVTRATASVLIPWHYAEYIGQVLKEASDGEAKNAARLLGLSSRKAGRHKGTSIYDETALLALYWLVIRHGFRSGGAQQLLQQHIGVDGSFIRRAKKKFPGFETLDEQLLLELVPPFLKYRRVLAALRASSKKKTVKKSR